jgi:hypothetical protein
MPIGYIIPVVLIAFCTTVAVIGPRPPHSTPSYWGYWLTFQINEQPFVAFYLLAIPTVLAFAQGDLASPGGLTAFAVAVLTVAGLAVLVRRALRAGPAVRRALADACIDLPLHRRPWAHILFAPLSVRRPDVTRVSNIAYGDAGRHNLLDIYHRRDRPTGAPVLVYGYYGRVAGPGSSPLDRLGDAPPFFFVHGDKDSSTLVEDTREFVARLRRASSHPVLYAELPGAEHTVDLLFSLRYSYVIEAVTAFCGWLRATQPKR